MFDPETIEVPSTGTAVDHTDVVVDSTVGGVQLLDANEHRKSALITNTGSSNMRVTTDGSAPTSTHGKQVVAGGSLMIGEPHVPIDKVLAIQEGSMSTTANASEVS